MDIKLAERRDVPDYAEMDGEAAEMVTDKDIEAEISARPAIISTPDLVPSEPEKKPVPASELTLEQLRFLVEQKLLEEANRAAEQKKFVKPPSKAVSGMVWVFNRGPETFVWQYDGTIYEIEGHEMLQLPVRVARHGKKRSLLSLDPLLNKAVFKLALYETEPIRDANKKIIGERIRDEKFGVPLKVVKRTELIDRSTSPSILGDGRPVPTHPQLIMVDGVKEMMSRRSSDFAELE